MRRRRRRGEPDIVELLLKAALEEFSPREFDQLLALTEDHFREMWERSRETTRLDLPSVPVVRGVCELVVWDAVDFVRIQTGLNAPSRKDAQIARQMFRIELFLRDEYAHAIRKYLILAVKSAVWELTTYRLIEGPRWR